MVQTHNYEQWFKLVNMNSGSNP